MIQQFYTFKVPCCILMLIFISLSKISSAQTLSIQGGLSVPTLIYSRTSTESGFFSGFAGPGYSYTAALGYRIGKKAGVYIKFSQCTHEVSDAFPSYYYSSNYIYKNVQKDSWKLTIVSIGFSLNYKIKNMYLRPLIDLGYFSVNDPSVTLGEVYDKSGHLLGISNLKFSIPNSAGNVGPIISLAFRTGYSINQNFSVFIEPSYSIGIMIPPEEANSVSFYNIPIGLAYSWKDK